ncbi:tyrosine protein phosphatase yvh1, partial [Modicella reniformis]
MPSSSGKSINEMQEVIPNLFLSGIEPAESRTQLNANGITHIIQITPVLYSPFPSTFVYKIIPVLDMDETNLIKHFPDTYKFIHEAIEEGGKVLVHCMGGASRSVTIVCAYLMKSKNMTADEAVSAVQLIRSIAEPNDGFMTQLYLYADIEFDVNIKRTKYRRFLIACMTLQRVNRRCIDDEILASDITENKVSEEVVVVSGGPSSSPTDSTPPTQQKIVSSLKCKKCHHALVAHDNVMTHIPGGQPQSQLQYWKHGIFLQVFDAIKSGVPTLTPPFTAD